MKLIVGAGYLGIRVARLWRAAGNNVAAVTRSATRAETLATTGIQPIVADVTTPPSLADLPNAETILFAVGFDPSCGMTQRQVYAEGLGNVLAALANSTHGNKVRRFLYISTTGVYAASEHDEVDEDSPCKPNTPGAMAHFEAERLLLASPFADRAVVLRMAGLYGDERIPRLDDLRAGRPIAAAGEGFVNLIHVDDAAAVVIAAEEQGTPGRIYNVSDGRPVNRREYLTEVARLIGAPEPIFVEPAENAVPTRGSASKRIGNRSLMAELGAELQYPSFREGLAASLKRMP
jgi:nucleoside-diphosphate-sugar epimerase